MKQQNNSKKARKTIDNKAIDKKAQAEIIGITIVMVLIMVGIIFVIRFVVLPDNSTIKQSFDRNQFAANFIDVTLKTSTNCRGFEMTELVQHCFESGGSQGLSPNDFCPSDPLICPGGCSSCDFLNTTFELILNNSLQKLPQFGYDIRMCEWDSFSNNCTQDIIGSFSQNSCFLKRNYDSKQQGIPTDVGLRVIQMNIC